MGQDRTQIVTTTNKKLHMFFWLVPKSITLDDLERLLHTSFQNTYNAAVAAATTTKATTTTTTAMATATTTMTRRRLPLLILTYDYYCLTSYGRTDNHLPWEIGREEMWTSLWASSPRHILSSSSTASENCHDREHTDLSAPPAESLIHCTQQKITLSHTRCH